MSIDRDNLRITGKHKVVSEPHFAVADDVTIVVTQAFDADGNNLVGISDVTFDDYPAVSLMLRADGQEGQVHLSPIHGDNRKKGFVDIQPGTRCELLSPVTGKPLDKIGEVDGPQDADYYALYLTPKLSKGSLVMISDVWGHYHSRIVDDFELISQWAAEDDKLG
jgi:hypothetical protein